jgi:hypothetical protein
MIVEERVQFFQRGDADALATNRSLEFVDFRLTHSATFCYRRVVTRRRAPEVNASLHHTTLEHKIAGKLIPVLAVNLVDKRLNGLPRIAQCPALPSQPRWTPQGKSSAPITRPPILKRGEIC